MSLYTINGNPVTFKGGTAIITPITVAGLPANSTNNAPLNVGIESGSLDGDASEVECETNLFGRLMISGNEKTSSDLSIYISAANQTAPMSNGTTWPLKFGDYIYANITGGSADVDGMFMISKMGIPSLDANEKMMLDITIASHGNISIVTKVVTGTAV